MKVRIGFQDEELYFWYQGTQLLSSCSTIRGHVTLLSSMMHGLVDARCSVSYNNMSRAWTIPILFEVFMAVTMKTPLFNTNIIIVWPIFGVFSPFSYRVFKFLWRQMVEFGGQKFGSSQYPVSAVKHLHIIVQGAYNETPNFWRCMNDKHVVFFLVLNFFCVMKGFKSPPKFFGYLMCHCWHIVLRKDGISSREGIIAVYG
jgi:hypothetical protein